MNTVKFIGMDVHKNSITIAIAEEGSRDAARPFGAINNDLEALDKFCRKMVSTASELYFVYEAGPCGYGIYHHLTGKGFNCMVAAPSMIPKRIGDRIKNDTRDAKTLARLHRAGELTAVYVPDTQDEAMRDLSRAREDAVVAGRKAKQRLNAFLLRHGMSYSGKTKWSKAYFNWLSDIAMPHPAQQIAFQEYIDAVHESLARIERLTEQIRQMVSDWRLAPIVDALQAARGVSLIVAVTMLSEIGDLNRFQHPGQLMAYLGLVPSEHSSGNHIKRGGITKTGNGHARKVLIEAAWAYRLQPRVSRVLLKRQENLPEPVRQIAWKAQLRLCARYRRLVAKGKTKQVVVTAIARELSAFLWAIAKQLQPVT
ncbi:IS110 family transposase [Desulfococcus multivorans]|jgi:transposase|uniref:Transposase IS116/IS110/IS902 family protein n=1 Tax=Desulfococcus multivorans DSM 2059 TaxID=1121405 RepID=S7UA21_DESML|nr:IS110 family transposase [Desulfococcus multivorans]AOY57129.1 transposase, IS116/IS110/IS902 family [Desulfococcus multivorans]AOY57570.1 transposase, IS116/IS110/IS902 family [Desulfococcus multivorans]AQU99627.1 IS110 family transposase [Desulfococcus multivorans]AQU99983.1 IS110 family transposase [Desulfococcus multivorans]EPR30749.1 transposase IS116/IS110/IS902 family protein [Desulfococcus multivorans DSM 2059]